MTKRYEDPFGPPWRFPWIRMLFTWQGSIFQIFWIEWSLAVLICTACLTAVYLSFKSQEDKLELSDSVERLADAMLFVARRFQAAIALMLGFYTIQNFNRWVAIRDLESAVLGTINEIALRIAWTIQNKQVRVGDDECNHESNNNPESNVPDATKTQQSTYTQNTKSSSDYRNNENVRRELMRWLNLSHAIVIGEVYEKRSNAFSTLEKIQDMGLATREEYKMLIQQERLGYHFMLPFVWFMDLLQKLQKEEEEGGGGALGLTDIVIGSFTPGLLTIRRSLADLYRFRNVPIPLSYRQLTNMVVRLYVILLMFAACLSEKSQEDSLGRLSPGSFWIILVFAFEYFLFVGWLTVADAIGNPFRGWADELEWENYVKSLLVSSMLIANRFQATGASNNIDDEKRRLNKKDEDANKLNMTLHQWNVQEEVSLVKPSAPKQLPKGLVGTRKLATGF